MAVTRICVYILVKRLTELTYFADSNGNHHVKIRLILSSVFVFRFATIRIAPMRRMTNPFLNSINTLLTTNISILTGLKCLMMNGKSGKRPRCSWMTILSNVRGIHLLLITTLYLLGTSNAYATIKYVRTTIRLLITWFKVSWTEWSLNRYSCAVTSKKVILTHSQLLQAAPEIRKAWKEREERNQHSHLHSAESQACLSYGDQPESGPPLFQGGIPACEAL